VLGALQIFGAFVYIPEESECGVLNKDSWIKKYLII